jgi:hypothetical protein
MGYRLTSDSADFRPRLGIHEPGILVFPGRNLDCATRIMNHQPTNAFVTHEQIRTASQNKERHFMLPCQTDVGPQFRQGMRYHKQICWSTDAKSRVLGQQFTFQDRIS